MASVPPGVGSVFQEWSDEFCATVWPRFRVLVFAAIVCVGRHTICRLLRIAGAVGRRSLVELSPRPLEAALVDLAAGADPRSARNRPLRPAWHDLHQWRRHGHAASGEEGLRQGAAPRCRPVHALLHGMEVGTQMGGAGDSGAVARFEPPVGLAGAVRSCTGLPKRTRSGAAATRRRAI